MFVFVLLYVLTLLTQYWCSAEIETLSEILSQFPNRTVAYHYGNSQLKVLENLLQLTANENRPIYLINYDGKQKISQFLGKQLLHVALIEKPSQLKAYNLISDLYHKNMVIVASKTITDRKQQKAICETNDLCKSAAVFIFGLMDGSLSICRYYCGKEKIGLRTIRDGNKPPQLEKYFNYFEDFRGYTFKVGYNEYAPFFYKLNANQSNFNGPEWAMLSVASKLLNFKYVVSECYPNSTHSSKDLLVEKVHLREYDFAVGGISQTLMRTSRENLEYTRYIQFQSYMVTYEINEDRKLGSYTVQFWYFYNWRSLFLIGAGVVGIALVTKLSVKLSKKTSDSFGKYTIMTVLYLVEQQSTKFKLSVKQWKPYIKLLFLFWLFTCLYLLANYKSVQAYVLITSKTGPNNIRDLMKKGFGMQIESDDLFNVKRHCQYSNVEDCSILLEKLDAFKTDVCGVLRCVLSERVALIGEEEYLKFTALRLCNLSNHEKQSLRFVPTTIVPNEWHGWPFKKSAPFIDSFSRLISRMESSGLIKYWYNRDTNVYSNYLKIKTQFRSEHRPLNIFDFFYPFIILIIGYIISMSVLIKEMKSIPSVA